MKRNEKLKKMKQQKKCIRITLHLNNAEMGLIMKKYPGLVPKELPKAIRSTLLERLQSKSTGDVSKPKDDLTQIHGVEIITIKNRKELF